MNGHVRKRGGRWEIMLEVGEQLAQRCPQCIDTRGRSRRHWIDKGRLDRCPKCAGPLELVTARRQIYLSENFATKREAQARLTRELHAGMSGTFAEPDKLTVAEFLQEHWLPAIAGTVRPTSLHLYKLHVNSRIVPHIGRIRLQKLAPRDIDVLYARLANEPGPRGHSLSPASVRAVHRVLHRALTKAMEWNIIVRNPADRAERPKVARPEMKTWTREDLSAFLDSTEGERLHPLWRVLAMTGSRRGEALALRWSDVDLVGRRLTVRRSRVQVGYETLEQDTKTGRSRVIAIDEGTVEALRRQAEQQRADQDEWLGAWQGDGHVFAREDGKPWHPDRITKLFEQALQAARLPRIRLHDLRHTHATLALQAGIHPKVVSERLGHAQVSMTLDTYSHAIPALQESAAALIAALVDAS